MRSFTFSAALLLFGASSVLAAPRDNLQPRALVSNNGKCGGLLIFGQTCKGSRYGDCCSKSGQCGSGTAFCGSGCQKSWGDCANENPFQQTSTDGKCGGLLGIGKTCLGSVFGNCCSSYGWCGDTAGHCGTGCNSAYGSCGIKPSSSVTPPQSSSKVSVPSSSVVQVPSSSKVVVPSSSSKPSSPSESGKPSTVISTAPSASASLKVSTMGDCGAASGTTCQGSVFGNCCSEYGYCGSTDIYCGTGCNPLYGTCGQQSGSSSVPAVSISSQIKEISSSVTESVPSGSSIASSSSTASGSSSASGSATSSAGTCSRTQAPAAGALPNCTRCQGQPGTNKFCGYTVDSNYHEVTPKTCNVVRYTLDITETFISPDGIRRYAQVINGQMPGPAIKASWGDTVVVTINNKMSLNGTSIHFHGIRQTNNNLNDGVPSITQCPIAPGDSQTYSFVANHYGSSWYHSHFAIQTWQGVFGPLIIDGPTTKEYDEDLGPVFLQDWSHKTVDEMYGTAENAAINPATGAPYGGPQTMQNGLINGKNTWGSNGSSIGERYRFNNIQKGKKYRLRVINSSIQSTFKFYIDGHKFDVIAMDFVPIRPYSTNILNINIGQRYDIIVTADQDAGLYWMRADNQEQCAHTVQNRDTKAIFAYNGQVGTPTSTGYNYTDTCTDEPYASLVPQVPLNAGPADITNPTMNVVTANNGANLFKWLLNGKTFFSDWSEPTLLGIEQNNTAINNSGSLLIETPEEGKMVYLIIESPVPLPHPIHLHGHDFWVLAQGRGTYVASGGVINTVNPPRRDTVLMPAAGYVVIGWRTDNPGVWLAHCHLGWHTSMGFALQFLEMKDKIKSSGALNNSCALTETCAKWNKFADENDIVVHDSGV